MKNIDELKNKMNSLNAEDFYYFITYGLNCEHCIHTYNTASCANDKCCNGKIKWLESEVENEL